jgi:hypothetical protein
MKLQGHLSSKQANTTDANSRQKAILTSCEAMHEFMRENSKACEQNRVSQKTCPHKLHTDHGRYIC